jgi:hypothetical protein
VYGKGKKKVGKCDSTRNKEEIKGYLILNGTYNM